MIIYPSPFDETRNSPTMTPTQDSPTLTFSVEIMTGKEAGKIASLKICSRFAPKVCNTLI